MSLFDRLRKIREGNEQQGRNREREAQKAATKHKKDIELQSEKFSRFLHNEVKPILDEINQALADGEGFISENVYSGGATHSSLKLRWGVRSARSSRDDPYSESGYSIEIGLERNDKVWLRVGRGVRKETYHLYDRRWKKHISDRIVDHHQKDELFYSE